MKILIIAYSFFPAKSVAAIRTTYWAEEMVNTHNFDVDVITVENPDEVTKPVYNTIVVPHKSIASRFALIKDEGLSWKKDVLDYFNNKEIEYVYDYVIISGGPFLHFDLGRKLKKKGVVKNAILDYRDPFSYNPRFNDSFTKRLIKKGVELYLNYGSDLILSVNNYCLNYIVNLSNAKKIVVPNGYDERFFSESNYNSSTELNAKVLVYPGKFYWHPVEFFETIKRNGYCIKHAGPRSSLNLEEIDSKSYYDYNGIISQKQIPDFLCKGSIGVIFLSEIPFESTTKIFDYLALNMKVLVITKGEKEDGVMGALLRDYPNVAWALENEKDIAVALEKLENMKVESVDTTNFSRKYALSSLVEYL